MPRPAAFDIGIHLAPFALCVIYVLRQTKARGPSLEVILLLLVTFQLGSIVLMYGGVISSDVFRIAYWAILITLVCSAILRIKDTAATG